MFQIKISYHNNMLARYNSHLLPLTTMWIWVIEEIKLILSKTTSSNATRPLLYTVHISIHDDYCLMNVII